MAWAGYTRLLKSHPLATKAITSGVLTAVSDMGLQLYECDAQGRIAAALQDRYGRAKAVMINLQNGCPVNVGFEPRSTRWEEQIRLDPKRTSVLAGVGLLYSGPVNHYWFQLVDRIVRLRRLWLAAIAKLFLDQLFFAPLAIAGYMAVRGFMEGRSVDFVLQRLQLKWVDATLACYQFWPVVNLVSFAVVPTMYRVLFGNFCALFWNARLSAINSGQLQEVAAERILKPANFEPKPLSTETLERIVSRRLEAVPAQVARLLTRPWSEEAGPHSSEGADEELPLPTLGRALAYRYFQVVFPMGCLAPDDIILMSDAELRARSKVCNCMRCRAMRA